MAGPGWYPDPGGSGRFRYWDGTRWSSETSATPGAPPPGGSPPGGSPPGGSALGGSPLGAGSSGDVPRRGGKGALAAIIALLALVVVGAIVVFVVIRPFGGDGNELTGPQPTPTISAWNDGSTPPPPPSPSSTPSQSHSPSATQPQPSDSDSGEPPPPAVTCPEGNPYERAAHPQDGRVHGGGLSFAEIPSWTHQDQVMGLSFAYDVGDQTHMLTDNWFAMNAVGMIKKEQGFGDPHQAASSLMQCIASSSFYANMTSATEQENHAVTISGHQGWMIQTKIYCDVDGYPDIKGDVAVVIVVDTGAQGGFGMYFGSATIGDQYTLNAEKSAMKSLQVD